MNLSLFIHGGESANQLRNYYSLKKNYEIRNCFGYIIKQIREFLINCVEFFCNTKNRPQIDWVSRRQTGSKHDARENKLTGETRECSLPVCKHIKPSALRFTAMQYTQHSQLTYASERSEGLLSPDFSATLLLRNVFGTFITQTLSYNSQVITSLSHFHSYFIHIKHPLVLLYFPFLRL
jgi:hypothetical protein